MATYVGKWDCPACGTKRIPGWKDGATVERCPACGSPTTGKWYLDDREMVLADPEEIESAKRKRAWKCGHCQHVNDAESTVCVSCGNARDQESADVQFVSREYSPDDVPTDEANTEDALTENVTGTPSETQRGYSRKGRAAAAAFAQKVKAKRKWILRGLLGVGILGVLLALLLNWKTTVTVTVVGFSWERSVDIEAYGPHNENSWSLPPAGAYNVSSSQEIHHHNTVVIDRECHTETVTEVCGTIDNGNGTFSDKYCTTTKEICNDVTRDEPVYATKYYYTIDRWAFDHTEKAGAKDHSPRWPIDGRTKTHATQYREGQKKAKYTLHFVWKGDRMGTEDIPEPRWNALKVGDVLEGYKNVVFGHWMGLKN